MAADSFNIADAQDMSYAQPDTDTGLCQELNDMSNDQQMAILKQESQRVSDSAQTILPDLFLSDDQCVDTQPDQAGNAQSTAPDATNQSAKEPVILQPIEAQEAQQIPAVDLQPIEAPEAQQIPAVDLQPIQPPTCDRQPNNLVQPQDIQQLFNKDFDRLDADKDGFVSKGELDSAFSDPCVTGGDAQVVSALRNSFVALEGLSNDELGPENDGITKADMSKFNDLVSKQNRSVDEESLVDTVDGSLYNTKQANDNINRGLYADPSDPLSSITPEAVKQGQIGDCYLTSALGAVAAQDPEAIKNMIKDNANGTYSVTFPDAPDKPVTVNAPTDDEIAQFAGDTQYGSWPAVIEKAYGKRIDQNRVVAQDAIPDGSFLSTGLSALTGKDIDSDTLAFTSLSATDRKLTEAMDDHRPVTAGVFKNLFGGSSPIPDGHAYSVLDYDSDSKQVTIRNPWGNIEPHDARGHALDGNDDGIFSLSLQDFDKIFSEVAYTEN
jgi:hypothetical protein